MDTDREGEVTQKIIGCAYAVSNQLGVGFLEKVYENALALELAEEGLLVEQQRPMSVSYRGQTVGEYMVDLLVEDSVVLELKSCKAIDPVHEAQLLNYLRVGSYSVGLLLNFGTARLGIRRFML